MTKIQSPEPERHHPNDVKRLKENDSAVVTRMNIDAVGYIGPIALIFFFDSINIMHIRPISALIVVT